MAPDFDAVTQQGRVISDGAPFRQKGGSSSLSKDQGGREEGGLKAERPLISGGETEKKK